MIKIAIIGPESTGKTELCKKLAEYYKAVWEPELARKYVETRGNTYTQDDVLEIAKLQIEQEKKYEDQSEEALVFFDTELIITKVWLLHKYKIVPEFVEEKLKDGFFDFYLLCDADLPWKFDPVRENGDNREFFLHWYESEVKALRKPYRLISGKGHLRLKNAIVAIEEFISKKNKTEKNHRRNLNE